MLAKYEVFHVLIGTPIDQLPAWIAAWNKVDPSLLSITDINKDGILQLNEMSIGGDIIVLATPEIGGLPYVISGLVAAGGLAAALSTADGLLLTIANALSHDMYYKMIDPNASTARRVDNFQMLCGGGPLRRLRGSQKRRHPVLVSAAFSFGRRRSSGARSGHFWKRANRVGASLGMVAGLGTTSNMVMNQPWLRGIFGITSQLTCGSASAHLRRRVRRPVGIAVIIVASLLTPEPRKHIRNWWITCAIQA